MSLCSGGCHTVFLHPLLDGRSDFPEPFYFMPWTAPLRNMLLQGSFQCHLGYPLLEVWQLLLFPVLIVQFYPLALFDN